MEQSNIISIIVPIFNAESTLIRCLDSILSQSFTDFELLLIDDGSVDGSLKICDMYAEKDSRISVWHKDNGGISSARNFGLDKAVGKYICFADADDYVTDIWLDSLFQCVCKHPDSLVIQNVLIEEPSRVFLRYNGLDGLFLIEKIWSLGNWGYSWNKIFRKDIIDRQGLRFDESLKVFEDELFVARYSSSLETAYIIPSVGYHYLNTVLLADKYKDELTYDTMKYLYRRVKIYNPKCSMFMVDRIVMSVYTEMKYRNNFESLVYFLKEEIGKDIRYVCGRKKALIRLLHKTNRIGCWKFVFRFYLRFNLI